MKNDYDSWIFNFMEITFCQNKIILNWLFNYGTLNYHQGEWKPFQQKISMNSTLDDDVKCKVDVCYSDLACKLKCGDIHQL
jgi:hypothetical protein